ncbi:hypothetical protein [Actinokineospora cianjurensis]|uniref:Uncharacterized protein n=1 Tax=Actinokineospora cianjurensis TaxID=585224 RepID=A0A421B4U7_9PSEU|nr:hypothetical protein [Actinokineospora cianjurensis]RLK59472.1 hypothetical protein CLV68_3961 [Actinokineospora cianjurensis]
MYLQIVAWDLSRSQATVEGLRGYLKDYAVDAYSTLDGMAMKVWFGNPEKQVWGAVYLWDSLEHAHGITTVTRVVDLIGYPPTSVSVFPVEAISRGRSRHDVIVGLGLALEN